MENALLWLALLEAGLRCLIALATLHLMMRTYRRK